MSWFENQISYSALKDDEALNEAYLEIVGSVVGHKIQQQWQDNSYAAKTALEDICKYYRIKQTQIPEKIKDINAQLDFVFQPCGFTRRTVKLQKGWHKNAVGAMLGTFKDSGNVVALIPGKMGGYVYRDPNGGKFVKVTSKNADTIDAEAVVFYRPLPLRKITIKDLFIFMRNCLDFSDIFWYVITAAVITLLGLITPKLTNILFSQVTLYGSVKLLLGIIIFMVCQTVAVQLINGVKALLLAKINTKLDLFVQSATVMRLFAMPAGFFRKYTAGELNQHIQYMNSLCNAITSTVFSTALTGLFSLVYIFQIFRFAPSLVLPAIIIMIVTLIVQMITIFASIEDSRQLMEETSKEKGAVYSTITGVQKIKLCGAEKRAFARWGRQYAKESDKAYNPPFIVKYGTVISSAVGVIGTVVLYFTAVQNKVTVADFYSFTTAYAYITAAFTALATIAQTFATIKPVLQIIKPIMDAEPEISESKEVVTRLRGGIEINHISFGYPDTDTLVLKDISLKIKPGQYVAIVGESGCGKSTLMRLLLGFEEPKKGAIYYDGKNIEKLDKKSLRRNIGVVMQGGKLMWGDIFSNITVSAPWLTLDDAWEAAEIAGIADDIRAMPMGMNTIIQEGSGGISGGQRQRIMIARAVAPKPKVLFLDEATSALDNITQKKVSEAMDKMKCTRIVIAHRLSTIKQCDRIILLKDGVICEDGSFDELIEKKGYFAQLVERQMVSKKS